MAQKYVPHTFRTGEVIEPTRVNENARALANEFNGNLDRENLREDAIKASHIAVQSCNRIGHVQSIAKTPVQMFGADFSATASFRTAMLQTFTLKSDAVLLCSFEFTYDWVNTGTSYTPYSNVTSGGFIPINSQSVSSYNEVVSIAIFSLLINGVEVSRARSVIFRKTDSIFLSGVQPVAAGQVDVECQVKIIDVTETHKFHISFGTNVLNFKFKKR